MMDSIGNTINYTHNLPTLIEQDESDIVDKAKAQSPDSGSPPNENQVKSGCRVVSPCNEITNRGENAIANLRDNPSGGTVITTETNTKRTTTTFIPGAVNHDGIGTDSTTITSQDMGVISAQLQTLKTNINDVLEKIGIPSGSQYLNGSQETTERNDTLSRFVELFGQMLCTTGDINTLLNQAKQENQSQKAISLLQQQADHHFLMQLKSVLGALQQLEFSNNLQQKLKTHIEVFSESAANYALQPNETIISISEHGVKPMDPLIADGIEPESSQSISKQILSFCNRRKACVSRIVIGTALTGYGIYSLTLGKYGQPPSSATTRGPSDGNNAHTIATGIFLVNSGVGLFATELASWCFSKAQPACVAWRNRLCDICSPSGSVRLRTTPDNPVTYSASSNVVLP